MNTREIISWARPSLRFDLARLFGNGHDVAAVSPSDKPAGRGKQMHMLSEEARSHKGFLSINRPGSR